MKTSSLLLRCDGVYLAIRAYRSRGRLKPQFPFEEILSQLVGALMRTECEKYYGPIRQSFAKAELALLYFATFLTDNEDDSEVAVDTRAAAPAQIQALSTAPSWSVLW